MGNYQDYLKQTNPLRELDPGMNRAHMFGNPFKLAKDQVCTFIMFLYMAVWKPP
jgi:integrator complex subunit 6